MVIGFLRFQAKKKGKLDGFPFTEFCLFEFGQGSAVLEHLVHVLGVQDSFGPEIELFRRGFA